MCLGKALGQNRGRDRWPRDAGPARAGGRLGAAGRGRQGQTWSRKSVEQVDVVQTSKLEACKQMLNRDAGYQVLVGQGGPMCIICFSSSMRRLPVWLPLAAFSPPFAARTRR